MSRFTTGGRALAAGAVLASVALVGAQVAGAASVRHAATPRVARVVAPAMPARSTLPRHAGPNRVAPRATGAAATFTVTTATDSPLQTSTLKTCHDLANGACSLRAAVMAANNLDKPVVIKLGAHTYTLNDAVDGALVLTNAGGTTIQGASMSTTKIVVPPASSYEALSATQGAGSVGSTTFVSNATLQGGSGTYGGVVYLYGWNTAMVLDSVRVVGGTATYGGGVANYEGSLWMTGSSISSSTAVDEGGGLYDYYGNTYLTTTAVNGNVVNNPSSSSYGGGIFSYYGNVHLTGGAVAGNSAGTPTESGYGGGIYDEYCGDVIVGTHVMHNTVMASGQGGGLYVAYADDNVTGAQFAYDEALGTTSAGGGISVSAGQLYLHHTDVSHDSTQSTSSADGGGGLYLGLDQAPGMVVIDDHSTFTANATSAISVWQYYGGATLEVDATTFKGNTSGIIGGGAISYYNYDEYSGVTVSLAGDTFLANRDSGSGAAGAVYLYGYDYSGTTLTATGCVFKGNVATGPQGTGAVEVIDDGFSQTYARIDGSTFSGNRAPDQGEGGAVSIYHGKTSGNATLQMTHDTVTGNTAGSSGAGQQGQGGGVYANQYSYVSILASTISGNLANGTGAVGGAGGGLYDNSSMGALLAGDTFASNHATGKTSQGGGLYLDPEYGTVRIEASMIEGNTAIQGAGIYLYYYQLDISGTTIANNFAGTAGERGIGGGIYDYASVISLENSTVTGNKAVSGVGGPGQGGALYNEDGESTLWFSTVAGNYAPQGAGVFASTTAATGVLRDSILAGNRVSPKGAEADCAMSSVSQRLGTAGGNVLSRSNCVKVLGIGDTLTAKPVVAALKANGGPTMTMALAAGSAALNAAHGDCLSTDQRGSARPHPVCDAGAYQHAGAKKA